MKFIKTVKTYTVTEFVLSFSDSTAYRNFTVLKKMEKSIIDSEVKPESYTVTDIFGNVLESTSYTYVKLAKYLPF